MDRIEQSGWVGFAVGMAVTCLLVSSFFALEGANAHGKSKVTLECAEDDMIFGSGDFDDGRWEHYHCVNVEDTVRTMIHEDEALHDDVERVLCKRQRHWWRQHGVEIMAESCD